MTIKTDWLIEAYRTNTPIEAIHTFTPLSSGDDDDGGRYGGGEADYTVWK